MTPPQTFRTVGALLGLAATVSIVAGQDTCGAGLAGGAATLLTLSQTLVEARRSRTVEVVPDSSWAVA